MFLDDFAKQTLIKKNAIFSINNNLQEAGREMRKNWNNHEVKLRIASGSNSQCVDLNGKLKQTITTTS